MSFLGQAFIAGVTLSRDVFSSGTAIFVMVAALQPGSLTTMSWVPLLTHCERVIQVKNKPLCFKSVRCEGCLLLQHNLAYPNCYISYMIVSKLLIFSEHEFLMFNIRMLTFLGL